jgi:multiple sugar transport system ATP-binding protein
MSPKDRDIAMVFQSYALYPTMSVRENIEFGLKIRKMSQAAIDEEVARVAKLLQIEHLLNRKPGQLSGGQQQRVAMGGRWRGGRRSTCSTSRCPTSTPSCGSRCALK